MTTEQFYIIRRRKDDSIVAVGTIEECMRSMGVKTRSTFRSIVSRNRTGRNHKYEIDVEDLDEEVC